MIEDIEKRIAQLKLVDVDKILKDIIQQLTEYVVNFNKFDQLYEKGIYTSGQQLPPYVPATIKRKIKKNQPYDRKTLKDTGDFYSGWFVKLGNDAFTLGSDERKNIFLQANWGSEIFGLTDESIEKLRALVLPLLQERLKVIFEK
jgi:hypothetical protein